MLTCYKKILILLSYIIGMFLLPSFIGGILAKIRGYSIGQLTTTERFNLIGMMNFIMYLVLCSILLSLSYHSFKNDFKKVNNWFKLILKMFACLFLTFSAAAIGNILVGILGTGGQSQNQQAVQSAITAMPLFMIITVTFLGPITEEIVFRLALMNILPNKPIFGFINILFSSLIFGGIHVLRGGWLHIIPYFLMGLVFGIMYHKTKNIWNVTILHILHNGMTVVFMYLALLLGT